MIVFRPTINSLTPGGNTTGSTGISQNQRALFVIPAPTGGQLTSFSFYSTNSLSNLQWALHVLNVNDYTPSGSAIATGTVNSTGGSWTTVSLNQTLTSGIYCMTILNPNTSGLVLRHRDFFWHPTPFYIQRYQSGGSWTTPTTPIGWVYRYTMDGQECGNPFLNTDSETLSSTSVRLGCAFDLPFTIQLSAVQIPHTWNGPYVVRIWSLGSNNLPASELASGQAGDLAYNANVQQRLTTLVLSSVLEVQRFAVTLELTASGSTSTVWWGVLAASTSAQRSAVLSWAWGVRWNGSTWQLQDTLVRPVNLIGSVVTSGSGGGGGGGTTIIRRTPPIIYLT